MPIHTFTSVIQPSAHTQEWNRFRWYASCVVRVRAIIDHNALELWSDRGGPPLLPSLQSARFRFDPRCVQRMLRLLSAPMRDLTLDFDSPSHRAWDGSRMSTADILSNMATRSPDVEVLNLTFRTYPQDVCPVLPKFSCLRVLVVTGWMTPSLHKAIEALNHLETLYVKLYWARAEAGMESLQVRRYVSVKTIVILTLSEPLISAFRSTEFPMLECARLEVWPHSSDATEGLTQAMENLRNHASRLRSFYLTARSATAHGDRPPPQLTTVIGPLLRIPIMESLSITLEDNYSFALTRDDILAFPAAWPHITTLCLAHAPLATSSPPPSIRVFFELIAACPRLETLVLCARFDCGGRGEWQDVSVSPHATLRGLFLGLLLETGSYNPERTWRALAAAVDRAVPWMDLDRRLVRAEVVGAQAVETWRGVVGHIRDLRSESAVHAPSSPGW
ncbi:uncharacterized protein TRAVEDRAFT_48211 [Trametes versicolor FP-101664 SS1]|uniref:uncharacterized protein n=1 Tax=Trametes versicolor (strain FP-101664) TaxID=717944 RepID=UPI00046217AD|nr:uncharacterized protein TRAVEDRAFT_48211 [Trametes versicolor FP-101664 SS1]EIW57160.1 hypothetical protein TRAVEDRAFT_48211 [Trametes versicolor FP-101664 SS1]